MTSRRRAVLLVGIAVLAVVAVFLGLYFIVEGRTSDGGRSSDPGTAVLVTIEAALLGLALFAVLPALQEAASAAAAAEANRGSVDLQAVGDVMYGDWVGSRFPGETPLSILGTQARDLRSGRAVALTSLRAAASSPDAPGAVAEWWGRWRDLTQFRPVPTNVAAASAVAPWWGRWRSGAASAIPRAEAPGETQFAFHLADRLEYIGIMCFAGAIPLRILLPAMGNLVVEDWALSRHWVATYAEYVGTYRDVHVREEADRWRGWRRQGKPLGRLERVQYHRRHAEWIATIAVLWMARYFPSLGILSELTPKDWPEDRGRLAGRLLALSAATGPNLAPSVVRDIERYLGIRLNMDRVEPRKEEPS